MRDYLIIGHGIAGAMLSHQLIKRGRSVLVIDQPAMNNSSSVAAGIYNPITGRKMIKTWIADDLFPVIEPVYEELEQMLGLRFLHKIGIYRPFFGADEQNDWQGKSADEKYSHFIKGIEITHRKEIKLNDPYGGINLSPAGFLDIPTFLNGHKEFLKKSSSYKEAIFDENDIEIDTDTINFGNDKFKKLIFSNGIHVTKSNYFGWLPIHSVKGEILDVELPKPINTIYNRGIFILPNRRNISRVGSTYLNHFDNLEPSKESMDVLTEKLDKLLLENYNVLGIRSGIRPATKDRRPIIGKHPKYEHIYVFNGFGSKGVSLVPYFSMHMCEHLEDNTPLNKYVDLKRFETLYQNSPLK